MAQVLTWMRSAYSEADQTIIKFKAGVDSVAQQKKQAATQRAGLSFRAINLPGRPGYDPGLQRHHLLPRQLLSKRCFGVLFAAMSQDQLSFDDFRSNGLLLPANDAAALRIGLPLHRGPHRQYNAIVIEHVGQVEARWASVRWRSPVTAVSEAAAGLRLLQQALRARLLDPGVKRLALNRFDPLGHGVDFTQIDAMVDSLWPDDDPWAPETGQGPRTAANQVPLVIAINRLGAVHLAPRLACAC